jgi:hypothetical protein
MQKFKRLFQINKSKEEIKDKLDNEILVSVK